MKNKVSPFLHSHCHIQVFKEKRKQKLLKLLEIFYLGERSTVQLLFDLNSTVGDDSNTIFTPFSCNKIKRGIYLEKQLSNKKQKSRSLSSLSSSRWRWQSLPLESPRPRPPRRRLLLPPGPAQQGQLRQGRPGVHRPERGQPLQPRRMRKQMETYYTYYRPIQQNKETSNGIFGFFYWQRAFWKLNLAQ